MQERKSRDGKGKEVPDEKMTKCYNFPMSNENMHRYLNTTRYDENVSLSNGSCMHMKVIWIHGSCDEIMHLMLNKHLT